MKTIDAQQFWGKLLHAIRVQFNIKLPASQANYKRVVPFPSKDKVTAIGLYESELSKLNFFIAVDPKAKTNVHSLYTSIYMIDGTALDKDKLHSDQKKKWHVPIDMWAPVLDYSKAMMLLGESQGTATDQLDIAYPGQNEVPAVSQFKGQFPNQVNPDHYKKGGMEAIEAINAFFKDNYNLGNAFKYMARAGRKPNTPLETDVKKAVWYLVNELKTCLSKEELQAFLTDEIIKQHAN